MAIQIHNLDDETARVTFLLPDGAGEESVSVVGTFNDWEPGSNPMEPNESGGLSAEVDVPGGQDVQFRYLAENGRWFDDPDAEIGPDGNGIVRLGGSEPTDLRNRPMDNTSEATVDITGLEGSRIGATGSS